MPARKKAPATGHKVTKDFAVADGNGGYFKKGDVLPEGVDIESLKAKGLAE